MKKDSIQSIKIKPIGVVHSSFIFNEGTPIQSGGSNVVGEIEIFDEYLVIFNPKPVTTR